MNFKAALITLETGSQVFGLLEQDSDEFIYKSDGSQLYFQYEETAKFAALKFNQKYSYREEDEGEVTDTDLMQFADIVDDLHGDYNR